MLPGCCYAVTRESQQQVVARVYCYAVTAAGCCQGVAMQLLGSYNRRLLPGCCYAGTTAGCCQGVAMQLLQQVVARVLLCSYYSRLLSGCCYAVAK